MKSYEVKNLLTSYLKKVKLLKLKRERLNEKYAEIDNLRAVRYDTVNVKGGSRESVVEQAFLHITKYENECDRLQSELFSIEDEIAEIIPKLDEIEQSLIIERYMNGLSMSIISKKYYFNYDSLRNKYRKIFSKLSKN